jgi:hypothetical protein
MKNETAYKISVTAISVCFILAGVTLIRDNIDAAFVFLISVLIVWFNFGMWKE